MYCYVQKFILMFEMMNEMGVSKVVILRIVIIVIWESNGRSEVVEDCIFCKIINKEIPAEFVYEDEQVVAFNDANPHAPVHILIIPKEHISTMHDLTPEKKGLMGHLTWVISEIAREKKLDSYRVLANCGAGAGQVVFHLHFHLLGGRKLK